MIDQATTAAVRRSIMVQAPPERAFAVLTTGMSSWWPLESHHIGDAVAVEVVIEPFAGGRWFERDADGNECDWGSVTEWEPPTRALLAWHLTPEWTFDPDPAKATELEIRCTPQDGGTLVELEHRGFEKHAESGAVMREKVAAEGGWGELLELYAKSL
jgi:uncharacterized protein YndB with AHSA1/START domain